MREIVIRLRLLLMAGALCASVSVALDPARAMVDQGGAGAICHYWSLEGCVAACERNKALCDRSQWGSCNDDLQACMTDCSATCGGS